MAFHRRRPLAGLLLLLVLVLAVAAGLVPAWPSWPAGVAAWAAALLLWPDLAARVRWQVAVLLLIGAAGLSWGYSRGVAADWEQAVAANALLIAMLAAVSFLRLISQPRTEANEPLPRGRRAVASSLAAVHLFGAVINLSTVFIMADRIRTGAGLGRGQVIALVRGFSAAAFWSPFFAAMAAALTYAPGARLPVLMAAGAPLAAVAVLGTWQQVVRQEGQDFRGYPMHHRSLWLPALLALAILLLHGLWPALSVLALVSLLAPVVTLLVLGVQGRLGAFAAHVREALPRMASELSLFLAAGVMAAGIASAASQPELALPWTHFGALQAALTLVAMWLLALPGVHPVITIAAAGSLLAPLEPDPNLLAITFLAAWALGVATSPLSAMNLALHGAYRIPALKLLRWNLPYALLMLPAVWLVQYLYLRWAG